MKSYEEVLEALDLESIPTDAEMRLTNNVGYTIAHFMAKKGYTFPEDSELLKLADNKGVTVATVMANRS
jgi:hypothetical protein